MSVGAVDGDREPGLRLLQHCLEKLRTRDGINPIRLQVNRDAGPLLELSAVRRFAHLHTIDTAAAALHVTRYCTRHLLEGTDRIVADAVLSLSVLREAYESAGLDRSSINRLYSQSLTERRDALIQHWGQLHQAIGCTASVTPADRALRGQLEPATLSLLVDHLWRLSADQVTSPEELAAEQSLGGPGPQEGRGATAGRGRALVIGGAVMDVTFKVRALPQPETSAEAYAFDLSPGGKGLTQAVAAARLGLETQLVAAVGDDQFGDDIIRYLKSEGVGTARVKRVPNARTPFTGVITFELGRSMAVNWRNEAGVRLENKDVELPGGEIGQFDVVLITYEPPAQVVQHALARVLGDLDHRPLTIVSPAPPYPDGQTIGGRALGEIDYLVAHQWELNQFIAGVGELLDLDATASRLLRHGPGALCVPVEGGCAIYSHELGTFQAPGFPSINKDAAGARDALCAALGAQLVETSGVLSDQVVVWGMAAMAAATSDHGVPQSMPRRKQIEALLSRSRFEVRAREDA